MFTRPRTMLLGVLLGAAAVLVLGLVWSPSSTSSGGRDAAPPSAPPTGTPVSPPPAASDGVVRTVVPVYGFEEGAALVQGSDWQTVTKTLHTHLEGMAPIPKLDGTTREYYVGFRKADVLNRCASGPRWRFWYTWKNRPGHEFTVYRDWSHTYEGNIRWVKVPSNAAQARAAGVEPSGHPSWGYWRLEARIPQDCVDAGRNEMKGYGIWVMVVDRENGSSPSVTLSDETSGGSKVPYTIGGIGGNVYVSPDGQIGIGTDAPEAPLSVGGNVLAEEVIVKPQEEWADHVFEDSYDLPTLAKVSSFIEKKGHLPAVPSAESVEKNGLRLGQMDATLLRKVEELTLYAIEQKRRADSLAAQTDSLSRKVHHFRNRDQAQPKRIRALERQNELMRKRLDQLEQRIRSLSSQER